MKRILNYLLVVTIVCQSLSLMSQDIHFSQYYTSPLNLNPAQTGFFQGTYRFTANYKNQWRSVTAPYRTFSGAFDMSLLERNDKLDKFSGGLLINTDKAGDANYGTTQAYLSFSYIKAVTKSNNQYISVALQPGFTQRSLDADKLFFDSQFDGHGYNPNIPHGEHINRESFLFFDWGLGLYWHYMPMSGKRYEAGVALFHVNEPNQSLFENPEAILNRKLLVFGSMFLNIHDNIDAQPGLFYARQGNFQEFIFGSLFKYIRSPMPYNFSTFNMGLHFRAADALIVTAGFDYLDYTFGVSYDVNYSALTPASRHMGGLELSFKYILDTDKTYIKKVPCPIF